MRFNRISGFYTGGFNAKEHVMAVEDENDELNKVLVNRLNQLNAAIEAHEKKLKAMMVPRDVSYVYDKEDVEDDEGRWVGEVRFLMGIIKWQGGWRLCHGIDDDFGPPSRIQWKPLADSSIPDRIRASKHLDELRGKVLEEKKSLIPELEDAIENLAKSLDGDVDRGAKG